MANLIDRQATLKHIEKIRQDAMMIDDIRESNIIMRGMDLLEEVVRNQPSAQKRGWWIKDDDPVIKGHCSRCGWNSIWQESDVVGMDYCPNCGARMDGEGKDND